MLDFGYFIRGLVLFWRHKGNKMNKNILSDFVIKGRCWPNDLDFNFHMNNARYLRECDFGRYSYFLETGLWNVLLKRKKSGIKDANIVVSALQVQYRQSIQLGDQFKIITRLNGWDDKAFYFEQTMIINKNKQTAFLLLIRLPLTSRSITPQMLIDDLKIGLIKSPILSSNMINFKENYKLNFQQTKS